jgi:hypothetical protein
MDAWKNTSHLLGLFMVKVTTRLYDGCADGSTADAIVPTTRMLDLNRWAKCNMMELGYRGRDG